MLNPLNFDSPTKYFNYTFRSVTFVFSSVSKELKLVCARVVENSGILDLLIKLLEVVQPCLQAAKEQKDIQTPK